MPPEACCFLIAGAKVALISYHPNILLKNFQNNALFSKRGRHTYIYIYKGAGRKANNRAGDVNSRGYNKATGREDSEARGEQEDGETAKLQYEIGRGDEARGTGGSLPQIPHTNHA